MKTCKACLQDFPDENFHRDQRMRGGRQNRCKPCEAHRAKLYYEKNSKRVKHMQRLYRSQPEVMQARKEKKIARDSARDKTSSGFDIQNETMVSANTKPRGTDG